MTEFKKQFKRYFEINYWWLITITILGLSLSTTSHMEEHWVTCSFCIGFAALSALHTQLYRLRKSK